MPTLICTRTVLTVAPVDERSDSHVVFESIDAHDPPADRLRTTTLELDRYVWTDLGSPAEITVTVQPGAEPIEHESPPRVAGLVAVLRDAWNGPGTLGLIERDAPVEQAIASLEAAVGLVTPE